MTEKRKILILVENLPVPFDRRVWMEALSLAKAGYQVSVICPRGSYPRFHETLEEIAIYRYPLPSLDGLFGHTLEYTIALTMTFLLTLLVFFTRGFDVIQSANPPDIFFLIALLFKPLRKKYVFDHHDLMPEICDSRWTGWKRRVTRRLSILAERFTYSIADHVIATNESYKQVALTRGKLPEDRITVVRSAPRLSSFEAVEPDDRWRLGKQNLVAYLGVMGPNDGLDYLLHSIDSIVHTHERRDIQFVLVGGGDLQPAMKRMSQDLGLDEYVTFTGRIPDDQLIQILSSADLCVAPDPRDPLNDVSTMNKIVEYMALGKPIVSYNLKESMISAGNAAVYAKDNDTAEFADLVLALIDDPVKRRSMGKAGLERFKTLLAWEHQEYALINLYQMLFGLKPTLLPQIEPEVGQD